MIEIKKADDIFKKENNLTNDAYVCYDKSEVLGYIEYKVENENLILTKINSKENLITDGLVRQTMNNALDNGCKNCLFNDDIREILYNIRIIKNNAQNNIDILDFFIKLNCF